MAPTAALALCLLSSPPADAGIEEAIVGLYVTLQSGRSDLGTGFFSTANGQIVTAYHVINGAKKIRAVTANGQMYDDLRIDFIAPQRDLAVLQIISKPDTPVFLTFNSRIPDPAEPLALIGYPRGLPTQVIGARATSYQLMSSFTLRNERGQRLFKEDIAILPLDATIYSGMSGAPVVSGNEVLGVLSGSLDEGGTIAWMIPSRHLGELVEFVKRPEDVTAWPGFDLMAGGFRSLSRSYRVDTRAETLLNAYLDALDGYTEAGTRVNASATTLRAQLLVTRPLFQMFLADPALSADRETAMNYLEYPVDQFLGALGPYGQAHTDFSQATQSLVNAGYDVLNWAEELAQTNPDVRLHLARADQQVRSSAVSGSYYEAIGSDPQQLAQAVARFAAVSSKLSEGYTNASAREFVSAVLEIGQMVERDAALNSSARAVSEMRKTISSFRGLATHFEPLVYNRTQ